MTCFSLSLLVWSFSRLCPGLMSIQHILPISSTEGVSSQWVEFFITAKVRKVKQ